MRVVLQRAIANYIANRGRGTTPLERRRIVSMIDAGAGYASIQSEFGVPAANIDLILRLRAE